MCPTCTFLWASKSLAMHPQLTGKVFLPELGKPDISPIVGQRSALEVTVKRYPDTKHISVTAQRKVRYVVMVLLSHPPQTSALGGW